MALKRDVALAVADKLVARGKYDAALKEYGHLLEENPNDVLVLNKMGDICVLLNRPADSIGFFGKIADRYTRDGFFLKAIAIYKKINKLDPSKLDIYGALADLYHKQGLVPEARAQYQVLADHYLKQNQTSEAVAVYRKMAAVDPNDIKVPVRLADLLTAVGQTDQALMQYAVVGSMLVKRGALDEAVAVYQKALKIRPGDKKTLRDLVRSMLEHKDAEAAVLLLKAQPRDARDDVAAGGVARRDGPTGRGAPGGRGRDRVRSRPRRGPALPRARRGRARRPAPRLSRRCGRSSSTP